MKYVVINNLHKHDFAQFIIIIDKHVLEVF